MFQEKKNILYNFYYLWYVKDFHDEDIDSLELTENMNKNEAAVNEKGTILFLIVVQSYTKLDLK